MPERATSSETIRAGTPVRIGSVTLLPVERIALRLDVGHARSWLIAAKEPYALIVRDAGGLWAIGRNAAPLPLDALRNDVSGLEAALAAM